MKIRERLGRRWCDREHGCHRTHVDPIQEAVLRMSGIDYIRHWSLPPHTIMVSADIADALEKR